MAPTKSAFQTQQKKFGLENAKKEAEKIHKPNQSIHKKLGKQTIGWGCFLGPKISELVGMVLVWLENKGFKAPNAAFSKRVFEFLKGGWVGEKGLTKDGKRKQLLSIGGFFRH